MARRKIFAVYDGDTYIGDYTAVEAAPLLGIACATVSAYANSGARLRGALQNRSSGKHRNRYGTMGQGVGSGADRETGMVKRGWSRWTRWCWNSTAV